MNISIYITRDEQAAVAAAAKSAGVSLGKYAAEAVLGRAALDGYTPESVAVQKAVIEARKICADSFIIAALEAAKREASK